MARLLDALAVVDDILSATADDETRSVDEEDNQSRADFTKDEAAAVLVADEDFTDGDALHALEVLFQRAISTT